MNKKLAIAALIFLVPTVSFAADNVGGCGWGSKLFDGQSGLMPNALAATSNGLYGTNTFGMTSGTSGCTADGVVKSNWKTAMFIDGNKEALARDMSRGSGETLESLAAAMGVREEHKAAFFRLTKDNYARIFHSGNVSTGVVMVSLKEVLNSDSTLAQYSAAI
jgi:hypothetical protein